jgi:uncharacterized membrane protein
VHFAIALPVVILLLEFYNLFAKKRSIGGFSFILILLTLVFFALAYFTGGVDGKETFDLLSSEGKEELKAHKLLGVYLLLGSAVLLVLKLLAITGNKFFKLLFFVVLIALTVVTLNQGKEGGELTYEHGANVSKVKALDTALFDAKDDLEDALQEAEKVSKEVSIPEVKASDVQEPKAEVKVLETPSAPMLKEELPVKVIAPVKVVAPAMVAPVQEEVTQAPVTPTENEAVKKVLDNAAKVVKDAGEKALSQINAQ